MARAVSNVSFSSKQFELLPFEGEWLAHIGRPARSGIIFIYGKSGSGKTTYCLKLAKYLSQFVEKIAYDSLEQGVSPSLQAAWKRNKMEELGKKIILLDREPLNELRIRLKRRNAPSVVFIDSVAYLKDRVEDIVSLRHEFPRTLFIMIGQEKDGDAYGAKQLLIKHDADVKIRLVGGTAMCETRYETLDGFGGANLVVYEKRKKKFNAEVE